jgi:hypothetical protein
MYALAANYLFFVQMPQQAKFLARILVVWISVGRRGLGWLTGFLNLVGDSRGIRLESAAQVLHMILVT